MATHGPREYHGPVAFADRTTETLFYVESDGRHVSAIRFDGRVLWTRDLYGDVKKVLWTRDRLDDEERYLDRVLRGDVEDRKIVSIARAHPRDRDQKIVYLSIEFSSGDFGVVDPTNGGVIELGRD